MTNPQQADLSSTQPSNQSSEKHNDAAVDDDDEIFTRTSSNDDDQARIRRRAPTRHSIKSLSGRKTVPKQTATTEVKRSSSVQVYSHWHRKREISPHHQVRFFLFCPLTCDLLFTGNVGPSLSVISPWAILHISLVFIGEEQYWDPSIRQCWREWAVDGRLLMDIHLVVP